jgi:prevent-host-death family protein
MTKVDATDFRNRLGETTDLVVHGERVVVQRHGRPQYAVIPYPDFELLQELEDRIDLHEVQRRLRAEKGKKRISLEDLKKRVG